MSAIEGGLFDRYEAVRELGAGGMARVVLARDRLLERHVALKLLLTSDPELMQRLLHEARITARCRHDNVVAIHEVGYQNSCPYIVLEYLCGKPLSALLERAWRLPFARAVELLVPVLQALQHIHGVGVVHRDLKPDNLFVMESGTIKLLDFGIAKLLPHRSPQAPVEMASNPQLTRAGGIVGTYQYMSPEQWGNGVEIDHLSDIWACGVLLYRMICGCHPLHPRDGTQLLITAMPDVPMPSMSEAAPPDVPRELIAAVDRCLLKIKDQRWQSAGELLAALSPFLPSRAPEDVAARRSETLTLVMAPAPHVVPLGTQPEAVSVPTRGARPQHDLRSVEQRVVATEQPAPVGQPQTKTTTILFLAADPTGTNKFMLDRQAHDIQAELERAGWRDSFELITQWAPESLDLLRALRKKPTVVHFAGSGLHATDRRWGQALVGDNVSGLFLQGRSGHPQLVAPTALDQTFGAAGKSVKLVVMSACYSELQAEALLLHVDCVVGLRGAHPDAAKAYALGLYGALGENESVAAAHEHGCAAITLDGHDSEPPQLKVRRGVDANKLVLAAAVPSLRDRR